MTQLNSKPLGQSLKIDLHCHTTQSDGKLSPLELIDLAKAQNIDVLAITDHDTTSGYEMAKSYAKEQGIVLVPAAEVSCEWQGRVIHVVALDVDVENPLFQAGLEQIRAMRWERAERISAKLEKKNIFGALESVKTQVSGDIVGRVHFADFLQRRGLVKDTQQAFDRYLKQGRPAYTKQEWPTMEKVVGWIREAGGVAVIAHPGIYKMTSGKLNRMIQDFIEYGGQAMEVVNHPHVNSEQTGMADRAERYGLWASIGSDFHKPEQTYRNLGWLANMPEKCEPVWNHFPRTKLKE